MTDEDNWIPVCKGLIKAGPTQPSPSKCQHDYVLDDCLGEFDSVRERTRAVRKQGKVLCHWVDDY